jgi:hypothetical protein
MSSLLYVRLCQCLALILKCEWRLVTEINGAVCTEGTRLAQFERIRFCVTLDEVIQDYDEGLKVPIKCDRGCEKSTHGVDMGRGCLFSGSLYSLSPSVSVWN